MRGKSLQTGLDSPLLGSFQSANFVLQKAFLLLFVLSRLPKRVQNFAGMKNYSKGGVVERGECNKLMATDLVSRERIHDMVERLQGELSNTCIKED